MSRRDVAAPRPSKARDEFDTHAAIEAEARRRALGIHDAEIRKRQRLAHELADALRAPLIPGLPPHDLNRIAELRPRVGRAR